MSIRTTRKRAIIKLTYEELAQLIGVDVGSVRSVEPKQNKDCIEILIDDPKFTWDLSPEMQVPVIHGRMRNISIYVVEPLNK